MAGSGVSGAPEDCATAGLASSGSNAALARKPSRRKSMRRVVIVLSFDFVAPERFSRPLRACHAPKRGLSTLRLTKKLEVVNTKVDGLGHGSESLPMDITHLTEPWFANSERAHWKTHIVSPHGVAQ
jgi:hypothetical protein